MAIACFIVRDLEETDVANELATSLAPMKVSIESYRFKVRRLTDVPCIKAGEDNGQSKDVVILMERRHL
jgi:hypothetical protein